VVIPTHNRREKLRRLLDSLALGELVADRVVVVADRCTDGTQAMVREEFPSVCLVDSARVLRCAGGRTEGLRHTEHDYVFFVDDDNIVDRSCLRELVALMDTYPQIGLLGPLMLNYPEGGGVWCAGGEVKAMRVRHRTEEGCVPDPECPGTLKPCDYLPNAFLARREVVTEVAPLDSDTFPSNWGEQDQGMRVKRAGYEIRVAPGARVWHDCGYKSLTTRLSLYQIEDKARARLLFRRRWARGWVPWLQFWAVAFPVSSAYYLARFARNGHLAAWSAAYIRGTLRGARGPLPPPPGAAAR
jgi:hypothetical protein